MANDAPGELTRRETEIVFLIGRGLDSRHIARHLGIAYFTVRKHRSNILYKLQLNSAAQLAAYAVAVSADRTASDPASQQPGPP